MNGYGGVDDLGPQPGWRAEILQDAFGVILERLKHGGGVRIVADFLRKSPDE
jgi:hypothetical protein